MLEHLLCALSLLILYLLQTAIFSQTPLVNGTADLILLFLVAWSLQERVKNCLLWTAIAGVLISIVSAMPFYAPLFGYLGVLGISKLLQRKVWRAPILAMFIITLLGTFFQQALYVLMLQINGNPITWGESLDVVILPSALLNLIFALPIYAIVNELVGRMNPLEVDA